MVLRKILGEAGTPGAIETSLGFIVTGHVNAIKSSQLENNFCTFLALDNLVENMWDLEDIPNPQILSLEKKLNNLLNLRDLYHSIIQEYTDQRHMSMISSDLIEPSYFIPHHCVFKPDSVSTPCRIVFDASRKLIKIFLSMMFFIPVQNCKIILFRF